MRLKKYAFLFMITWMLAVPAILPPVCFAATPAAVDEILGAIPVQHGGRIKPFESFARETVLFITGKKRFQKQNPTGLVWQWIVSPESWNNRPLIPVGHPDIQKEFGLMMIDHRVSPEIALGHPPFLEKVQEAIQKQEKKDKLTLAEYKRIEIYERAHFFQAIAKGEDPGWVPHPEDALAGWMPLRGLMDPEGIQKLSGFFPDTQLRQAAESLRSLLGLLREDAVSVETVEAAGNFSMAMKEMMASSSIALDEKSLSREVFYNRFHPFRWASSLYFGAAFVFLFGLLVAGWRQSKFRVGLNFAALVLAATGFVFHTGGFVLRCLIAGRPPVTNMYESIIWVSWGVVLFSSVLFCFYRSPHIIHTSSWVAGLALLVAESFPVVLDPAISPLVPVLRSNLWLTVHVLTITLGYGAFLLAWGLGHAVVIRYVIRPKDHEQNRLLVQYLYRALQIGVLLLASGTVLGGVWANYSWGRFWGWDPKETWALIALLGYLTVLHGRFTGWLGSFGLAIGSVVAFLGVLMAWYGVNFVLAAGLHSYGFGGGGGAAYVLTVSALDLIIVFALAAVYKFKTRLIAC